MTMTKLSLKRFSTFALAAALLSAALMLAACNDGDDTPTATGTPAVTGTSTTPDPSPTAESETRTVEADNGTVEVPADPQRIAVISRATGSFLALDGEPIAVTELSTNNFAALLEHQQAAYRAATNLGPSGSEADLELLASLEPDLIIISVPDSDFEQMKDQLKAIAPTIFLSFQSDWKQRVEIIAEAGNLVDVLDQQKADYAGRVTAIKATYSQVIENDTFAEVSRGANSEPAVFTLNGSFCTEVVRADIGLDIVDLGEGGESRSYEQIGELADYDVILYPVDHEGNVTEAFRPMTETTAWQALPAVTSGRTVGVYCPQDRSYLGNSQYMESLDRGLAALPE
ncbi:MAG: ABC transporter substrate-binding protein [Acidimicrobiales bacterium]|nr:ABC transporter substrate-binding protein [Acidimicrobiales bacterium]